MKITVLGAGAWGTALARLLIQEGNPVVLWGHDADHLRDLQRIGRNERYLPGIELPRDLQFATDPARSIRDAECIVVAVPSKGFRDATQHLKKFSGIIISVTKGIEYET